MATAYEIIKNSFNKTKRDISFPPSLLSELSDEQRREVEGIIVDLCLHGDRVSYQYIGELKFYNPEEVFVPQSMEGITPYDQSTIYKILYDKFGKPEYFARILTNADTDINTYSMLSLIYCDSKEKDPNLYSELKSRADNSELHSAIFKVRCENLAPEAKAELNIK